MTDKEKKAIDMLEKYITEHKFYNIKQSDGLEDNIKILLDLYMQEKEKNEELSIIKEGIRVLQNNGLMDEQYIVIANWNLKNTSYKHLLDDYISKDKIMEMKRYREFELQQEYKDFENDSEWKTYNKILEEN